MTDLQTTWFLLVGVLFAGYSVLDGIDCGVGTLVLGRAAATRSGACALGSIGPATFGNEFWLVAGVAALFTAFPRCVRRCIAAFAPLLAAFVLVLVLRAAALGSGRASRGDRRPKSRDVAFGVLSVLAAFFPGLDSRERPARPASRPAGGRYAGTPGALLNPFALVRRTRGRRALRVAGRLLAEPAGWFPARREDQDTVLKVWVAVVAAARGLPGSSPSGPLRTSGSPTTTPSRGSPRSSCSWRSSRCRFSRRAGRARAALFSSSSTVIAALWGIVGQGLYPRIVPALGEVGREPDHRELGREPDGPDVPAPRPPRGAHPRRRLQRLRLPAVPRSLRSLGKPL